MTEAANVTNATKVENRWANIGLNAQRDLLGRKSGYGENWQALLLVAKSRMTMYSLSMAAFNLDERISSTPQDASTLNFKSNQLISPIPEFRLPSQGDEYTEVFQIHFIACVIFFTRRTRQPEGAPRQR